MGSNVLRRVREAAGGLANFGTVLPLCLGVALSAQFDLGLMLLFFGLWYIVTGLCYRLPVPVEPLKVVAAVVIAGRASQAEVAGAGLVLGLLFLVLGLLGGMGRIRRYIPEGVIRGIQLGLALVLARAALGLMRPDPWLALPAVALIVGFGLAERRLGLPDLSALVLFVLGSVLAFLGGDWEWAPRVALPALVLPSWSDILSGTWHLALPQVPLTFTNAILATSLLTRDLFQREVPPDRLAVSIGLMTLTTPLLGGFPMCHGAGGLAAQYRFGARSGLGNVVGGVVLLGMAFFLGQAGFVQAFPGAVFGALLLFIAWELGKTGLKTDRQGMALLIAVAALVFNMAAAFVMGLGLAWFLERRGRRPGA